MEYPIVTTIGDKYYSIQCDAIGTIYGQRRYVFQASDKPLSGHEKIIIALCDKITGKE